MPGKILLSTAYFPPSEYFGHIRNSEEVCIEQEENYLKQTYRNRCRILTSNGIMNLSVPVLKGGSIKTQTKDVRIDYSKRWQQIHLRALTSSYNRSPYFQFFSDSFEKILISNHKFLLDLNIELLKKCLEILQINKNISYTLSYEPVTVPDNDFRYRISPKVKSDIHQKAYIQVFNNSGFVPRLSILDLIFNMGLESIEYL
jgi:hypothetical protein